MSQRHRDMTGNARQSLERAAYAAVGAPTAALKALSARVSDLKDTLRASREEVSSELTHEIDEWIAEGEAVIDRALRRIRSSDVTGDMRAAARTTRKAARKRLDAATSAVQKGMDLIEPDETLTTINGVGPRYRDRLGRAGVVGISSFLDRTATEADRRDLAAASGLSIDMIESWRSQVHLSRIAGVGDAYELLLRRVGVWTLDQLIAAETSELAERMRAVSMPDTPDQLPTESLIERWQKEARRQAGSK